MTASLWTRRHLLRTGSALAAWSMAPRLASASSRDPRLVFVILRGALDGLAFLPPVGDPDYADLRGDLAVPVSGDGAALPLDGVFGLNPNLPGVKRLYDRGQALLLHAVATPYRDRSHFDGQDVLENGTSSPQGSETGWLNRVAGALPVGGIARGRDLFAGGTTIPLVMRGPAPVMSWSPGALRGSSGDTALRLMRLYGERDPALLAALVEGEKLNAMMDRTGMNPSAAGGAEGRLFSALAAAAGRVLARGDGPRIAALALDGWDTHANEGPGAGRLGLLLAGLDGALGTLEAELGPAWGETVVVVATEFGRTARVNGTDGTDHGTAAAAMLVGGAVRGGHVLSDWPGLRPTALFEGRDLKPTTDLRAVLKGVLQDHLGLLSGLLSTSIFPDSQQVAPLRDLLA